MYDVGEQANRKVTSRFLRAGIGIVLVSILQCIFVVSLVLAAGSDVSGGVAVQPVKAPAVVLADVRIPSQSVPQVLDRTGVSMEMNTLVQPGFVSGPMMGRVSNLQEITPPVGKQEEEGIITGENGGERIPVLLASDPKFNSNFCEELNFTGLCFSPYLTKDATTPDFVTNDEINELLEIIKFHTRKIRTFGAANGLENIPRIAHGKQFEVMMGAWINQDINSNEIQMQNLITNSKTGYVNIAAIGNEALLHGLAGEDDILSYISRFKEEVPNVRVTYVDIPGIIKDRPHIISAVDVVAVNLYPYWAGVPIDQALQWTKDKYEEIRAVSKGKEVIISEMGWPTFGDPCGTAVPSRENAYRYLRESTAWAEEENIQYFYFAAFDESWKYQEHNGVGPHWGVWYNNKQPKYQCPLTFSSITPSTGVNTGSVSVTITGTNFVAGTNTVHLTRSGQSTITATNLNRVSATQITCTLPISGKTAGDWNIVVTTGGQTVTKANAFRITSLVSSPDNIGVVRGKTWSVDYNGNGYWNSGDKTATFGVGDGKDKPITGDWNGNGKTNIGVVRGKIWYVDYNGNGYWDSGDKTATFGVGDGKDIPVAGDWNGNGKTNIGVVRGKIWYVDYNGNGYWDAGDKSATFGVGDGKDKPVTGDWSGNGKTNIGVVRGNKWYVDFNGNGYWDSGDKSATLGVGDGKDIPVTGDWNGNGKTNIGIVRGKTWYVDYNGNGYWDAGDKSATFGIGDGKDIPVVGKWSGTGVASVEANQVQEPENPIQPPIVTRPKSDIPRVEIPVKSSPDVRTATPGNIPSNTNPLVSKEGVRLPGSSPNYLNI